jgi:chemotaxis-related protein WspB
MLLLTFSAGGATYALEAGEVREVVPALALRPVPLAPAFVAGLLRYRGRNVPVLDAGLLLGGPPVPRLMSSRIILVDYPWPEGQARLLGLLAEGATDTLRLAEEELAAPALAVPEAPYLGHLAQAQGRLVQRLKPAELLSAEARALLVAAQGGEAELA